jgi:hypothetical protein
MGYVQVSLPRFTGLQAWQSRSRRELVWVECLLKANINNDASLTWSFRCDQVGDFAAQA